MKEKNQLGVGFLPWGRYVWQVCQGTSNKNHQADKRPLAGI